MFIISQTANKLFIVYIISSVFSFLFNAGSGHVYNHEDLLKLVLSEKVPSILGLVAITGLPHSHKSEVLKKVMMKNIRLKHGDSMVLEYLRSKHDPEGLSAYELPIIGNGPNYHAWFLAFKRCSATFCTLSALLQKRGFKRQAIDFVEDKNGDAIPNESGDTVPDENGDTILHSTLLDGQLKWLYKEMRENYKRIIADEQEQKVDLLRSGVCLINVFDLGINRALQEFFNIISRYCPNLVQLAFFDLARDAQQFLSPFKPSSSSQGIGGELVQRIGGELIKWRPRLHHLIQSPNPRKNLFVATYDSNESLSFLPEAQQLIKDEVERTQNQNVGENDPTKNQQPELYAIKVDGGDEEYAEFREKIDEKVFNLPKIDLPLKWIFLRSSLAVHQEKSLYVPVKAIEILGFELGMSTEDVEAFLMLFTSCGSLLYIPELPPLDVNVIINIQGFAKCLDVLFHSKTRHQPKSLEEGGIISLKTAEKKIPGAAEFVLKTLVGIGMASEIGGDRLRSESPLSSDESSDHYYYLPSARAVELKKKKKSSSAYIITSKRDLPVDSQARFTSAILKAIPEFQLAPSKYYNRTLFEYRKNGGNAPRLTITFHGEMTELRVNMKNVDPDKFPSPVRMCAKVLEVCLRHLSKQEIQFNVGLQCLRDPAADYHFLFSGRKDDEGDKEKSVKSSGEYHEKAEDCHEECLTETKESNLKRISWIQAGTEVCEVYILCLHLSDIQCTCIKCIQHTNTRMLYASYVCI